MKTSTKRTSWLLRAAIAIPLIGGMMSQEAVACTGGTYAGTIVTTGSWATQTVVAGQYHEFQAQAGENYIFTFCNPNGGSASWDPQISILDNLGNQVAYNDDYCGLLSYLSWYAPSTGTYRVLVNQYYCSSSGAVGTMAFYGPAIVTDDAGISGILSPALPKCDYDTADITVVVQNLGMATLTSCDIKWQVGSSSITTYSYTGSVAAAGGTDTVTIASNYVFSNGDEVIVWSENPNGSPDSLSMNDTSTVLLNEGLSGTYNIPNDYATLTAASDALNTFGVCDDVVFELNTGTYNEQVILGPIVGVNQDATVTFTSASGNASDVHITYSTVGSTDNHVVYLNGADWISFTDVSIRNTSTGYYATAVRLENEATNNTFDHCHIKAGSYSTTGNSVSAVYSYGMNHNLTLTNNRIEKGGYGIYVYGGSSTSRVDDLVMNNNMLEDAYYYANYIYYVNGFEFNNNVVTNDSNLYPYGPRGLYMYYVDNFNITGNFIGSDMASGSYGGYAYPFYMYGCMGSSNPRSLVANNCVNAGIEGSTSYGYYGFYSSSSGLYNFHNNSVTRRGGNSGYYTSQISNGGGISLKNNSFADYNNGYALYSSGAWNITESENNNFYNNGGSLIYFGSSAYSSLEAYQAGSGYDLNSVNTDPAWIDTLACVTCNDTLDNSGINTTAAMYDNDSNLRSVNTPDIGPREWVSPINFTLGGDSTYCADEVTIEAGPAQSVTWSVNGNSSSAPTLTLTGGSEATTFNVLVSIQTEFCGSGSDNALITLVPNAHLDSTEHICAGANTTLNPGGATSATYAWSTGATSQSLVVAAPGTYTVTKDEMGCVSSATSIVTQSDQVQIIGTDVCLADLPLTLDATINDGISYAWSGGNSPTTATNTFNTAGPYTVTATDAFGCSSVDSFEVVILEEPDAVISVVSNSGTIYIFDAGSSPFITANSIVNWNFGAGAVPATSTNVLETVTYPWSSPSNLASYSVSLEINNGCGVDIASMIITPDPLSVDELEAGQFAIYPNPANDVVTIATKEMGDSSIEILDMSGRTVASAMISAGSNKHEISIANLASGAYIVKVVSEGSSQMNQLIIQ